MQATFDAALLQGGDVTCAEKLLWPATGAPAHARLLAALPQRPLLFRRCVRVSCRVARRLAEYQLHGGDQLAFKLCRDLHRCDIALLEFSLNAAPCLL